MRIALDYDGTFDRDPELWRQFTVLARSRGHEVFILTRRWQHNRPVNEEGMEVIYCEDRQNIPKMLAHGHDMPDVCIDDRPWELGYPGGPL